MIIQRINSRTTNSLNSSNLQIHQGIELRNILLEYIPWIWIYSSHEYIHEYISLNRFNKCEYVSSILRTVQFTRSLWSQVQSFNEYIHKELIHEEYSYELNHPMNIVKMDIVSEFFHSLTQYYGTGNAWDTRATSKSKFLTS